MQTKTDIQYDTDTLIVILRTYTGRNNFFIGEDARYDVTLFLVVRRVLFAKSGQCDLK